MKKYYVVYADKYVGNKVLDLNKFSWVICVTESLEVAKDLCRKFNYSYSTETVGEERTTPDDVRNIEPRELV